MGFNPMEKMKMAAASKLNDAKYAAKAKASEMASAAKDATLDAAKKGAQAAGKGAKAAGKATLSVLKGEVEIPEMEETPEFTDADLECPVTVLLQDYFEDSQYSKEYEDDDDEDEEDYTFTKEELSPIVSVEFDKDPEYAYEDECPCCHKNKLLYTLSLFCLDMSRDPFQPGDRQNICSEECAKKFYEEKYKQPVFVTSDEDRHTAWTYAAEEFQKTGKSSALASGTGDGEIDYSKYPAEECCAECGKPFVITRSNYLVSLIDSFDKAHPCLKDKSLKKSEFCSVECGQNFFDKKYKGAYVTLSDAAYRARLAAGRKKLGTSTFADKLSAKAQESQKKQIEILEKQKAQKEALKNRSFLEKMFPVLGLFKKK